MAFWDKIKSQLIDIIEWLDDSNNTLVCRYERADNEIKYGAQLIVREGQQAVFINQGQLADVFKPGQYTLDTKNLPILSTLQGWKYGFESPFKAEVYFVSTRKFTNMKWGTKNPIMLRDKEFGPVRLRAFGSYVLHVTDAGKFIKEVVGTDGHFTTEEITDQLRNVVVSRFADVLGESKIPVLDLASNYDEFGNFVTDKIGDEIGNYGVAIDQLLIENISLPPNVEEALDKRSSMGILGDRMNQYAQYQAANAMETAAGNEGGGGAAAGMGLGAGFAMAGQMANMYNQPQNQPGGGQPAPGGPPPVPQAVQYYMAVNGAQQGPYDVGALNAQVQNGQLTRETLVWKNGMANWTKAGEVAELAPLFQAPPPVPGSPPPPPPAG